MVGALSQPGVIVTDSTFEKQSSYLSKTYAVIPLSELVDRIGAGGIDRRYCSITFDDGWRDVYDGAFPILRRHGLPAAVFLATGFVGTNRLFWPERIVRLLISRPEFGDAIRPDLSDIHSESAERISSILETTDEKSRLRRVDSLIELLKGVDPETRERLIGALKDRLAVGSEVPEEDRYLLDWNEIEEMRHSGISFGSHTVSHAILTTIPSNRVRLEVEQSKADLEEKLGEQADFFAYPNGNWDDRVRRAVEQAGYRAAVITENRRNDHSTDPFLIGRLNVHEGMSTSPWGRFSRAVFRCEISGFLHWLGEAVGMRGSTGP
jgi:peptidoglycan/xylan/chitin deacetylase (PgdA/CDA1 family)